MWLMRQSINPHFNILCDKFIHFETQRSLDTHFNIILNLHFWAFKSISLCMASEITNLLFIIYSFRIIKSQISSTRLQTHSNANLLKVSFLIVLNIFRFKFWFKILLSNCKKSNAFNHIKSLTHLNKCYFAKFCFALTFETCVCVYFHIEEMVEGRFPSNKKCTRHRLYMNLD